MFLNELKSNEKELFLKLCVHAANANGLFVGEEKEMIRAYCSEMQITMPSVIEQTGEEAIISDLKSASKKSKNIIILEILGLLQADNVVDEKERDFLKRVADGVGVDMDMVSSIENLLDEYKSVTRRIYEAIQA